MVQLKKKAVLLIGALMLLLGMGINLQYALDDYGWADNLAVQVLAAVTGDFDTTIYPGQPVEPGKVRDQVPCMYTEQIICFMKYITIVLLFLCLMSCHSGRQSSCEDVPVEKDSVQLRVIPVSISDTAYRNVDQTFEQISYVVLSDNVVIGEIVRTLVSDERIFILDNQNKLFCFDMQGKVEYVIDEHGSGS